MIFVFINKNQTDDGPKARKAFRFLNQPVVFANVGEGLGRMTPCLREPFEGVYGGC